MSAPWIEAWKAWCLRGAELFVKPAAPEPGKAQRVAPPKPSAAPPVAAKTQKAPPHRSGQRHG